MAQPSNQPLPLVQVTWMAYDMLVLRTNPETGQLLRKLEQEVLKCKAVLNSGCLHPVAGYTENQFQDTGL